MFCLWLLFLFFIALTNENQLYSFGYNDRGQLGHGDTETRTTPTLIEALLNLKINNLSCGTSHVGIVTGIFRIINVVGHTLAMEVLCRQKGYYSNSKASDSGS